jgi:hypothetical protein
MHSQAARRKKIKVHLVQSPPAADREGIIELQFHLKLIVDADPGFHKFSLVAGTDSWGRQSRPKGPCLDFTPDNGLTVFP